MHLKLFEIQKCRHWGSEHVEDLVDVVHVFSDNAVGGTECAHAHLLDDGSPVVQVRVEKDGIC